MKRSFNKSKQRGGVLVELALVTPILLIMISGLIWSGDILTQQPWASQSAYQLVDTLSSSSREIGVSVLQQRREQIFNERINRFSRFSLELDPEPLFSANDNPYYSSVNIQPTGAPAVVVPIAGVRFNASIFTAWKFSARTPMKLDIIAPVLVKSTNLSTVATFKSPPNGQLYDCCGIKCADGGQCSAGQPRSCQSDDVPNNSLCGLLN